MCSSTPKVLTPSNWAGSLIKTRLPSAETALLAVSRDPESRGDSDHNQMLDDDSCQCPPQSTTRQLARGSTTALVS